MINDKEGGLEVALFFYCNGYLHNYKKTFVSNGKMYYLCKK